MVGSAVRESVLPPGVEPDQARRRRARWAMAITAAIAILLLWGGSAWWSAEAESYATFVRYRPFNAAAAVAERAGASIGPERSGGGRRQRRRAFSTCRPTQSSMRSAIFRLLASSIIMCVVPSMPISSSLK